MKRIIVTLFFAFLTFFLILFYTWFNREAMEWWLVHSSYYVMLTIFSLWVIAIGRHCQVSAFCLQSFIKNYWQGILGASIFTAIVFISVTPDYRVLSDETNLLSISQSMTYEKTIYNTTMAKWYYNQFHPIEQIIPKRPFMFPFFISLLHNIFGYSRNNVFILNFLALWTLLLLTYCCTKAVLDKTCGFAAMLLILSQPIVALQATSGSFDLLSITFLGIVLVSLFTFVSNPQSEKLLLLWLNLIIFCNIRYESPVYILLIVFFLLIIRSIKIQYILNNYYFYALSPFLFLPSIWQQILKRGAYAEEEKFLFSFKYIVPNFLEIGQGQFRFDFFLPYANLVNLIGLIILAILVGNVVFNKKVIQGLGRKFFWAVIIFFMVHNCIYLAHYFGKYSHPSSARFFLLWAISLALVPIVYQGITKNFKNKFILFFSLISFILYHPTAISNKFQQTLTLNRKTTYVRKFIKSLNQKDILIIIDRPGQYTVENYGAISFNYANQNAAKILLEFERGLYQRIIVVQEFNYLNNKPLDTNILNNKFKLENIFKAQITANDFISISQVIF